MFRYSLINDIVKVQNWKLCKQKSSNQAESSIYIIVLYRCWQSGRVTCFVCLTTSKERCLSCHGFTWTVCERVREAEKPSQCVIKPNSETTVNSAVIQRKVGQKYNYKLSFKPIKTNHGLILEDYPQSVLTKRLFVSWMDPILPCVHGKALWLNFSTQIAALCREEALPKLWGTFDSPFPLNIEPGYIQYPQSLLRNQQ